MGRTKEFNEDAVVARAMEVFWELGYDGSSMADILAATGLSRSSLYGTFADKRSLFLRTVSEYASRSTAARQAAFANPELLPDSLAQYLRSRVTALANPEGRPAGCYLTAISASLKTADEELRSLVLSLTQRSEEDILEGFTRALASGSVPARASAKEWAALFLGLIWGLNVAARMGRPREVMDDMVSGFLASLSV
jgi:TetR/AcrR family transcriptional repressor of nem operon